MLVKFFTFNVACYRKVQKYSLKSGMFAVHHEIGVILSVTWHKVYFPFWAFLLQFIMTAVSVALPIPAGVFFPVFLIGKGLFS